MPSCQSEAIHAERGTRTGRSLSIPPCAPQAKATSPARPVPAPSSRMRAPSQTHGDLGLLWYDCCDPFCFLHTSALRRQFLADELLTQVPGKKHGSIPDHCSKLITLKALTSPHRLATRHGEDKHSVFVGHVLPTPDGRRYRLSIALGAFRKQAHIYSQSVSYRCCQSSKRHECRMLHTAMSTASSAQHCCNAA